MQNLLQDAAVLQDRPKQPSYVAETSVGEGKKKERIETKQCLLNSWKITLFHS